MSSETDLNAAVAVEPTPDVGAVVAGAVAIDAGMRVLDVGGDGSAAIAAARTGADVVALAGSAALVDDARARAREAGVQVEWLHGDPAALPFDDDSFDRVLTAFGATAAADHDLAASELVRVCRPGGEIVMAAWSPDGFAGRLATIVRGSRATDAVDPVDPGEWGTFGHPRRRLGGQLVLAIEPTSTDLVFDSADAMLARYEQQDVALVAARGELEPGRYEQLLGELRALIEELDAGDGQTLVPSAYKLVVGHKPVPDLRPNS